jgi:hypothetical protein
MADRFEIPLDIEGVKIERVDFTLQGEILIMVTSMVEGTRCHRCGQEIKDSYGYAHSSPHFYIMPNTSAKVRCSRSISPKRCMRGRSRSSGMVGISS